MHSTKGTIPKKVKEKKQDDIPTKKMDDKLKKSIFSVNTPRPLPQRSTTADIYSRQKALNAKKPLNNLTKTPPMKNIKSTTTKMDSARMSKANVKSPIVIRKPANPSERIKVNQGVSLNEVDMRQRRNTRTLEEHEVKVLTEVDNNREMMNLTKQLKAQPKVFYVDLNGEQSKDKSPSEEEVSYEDDFESYESDFDSYHSSTRTDSGSDKEEMQLKDESMLDSGTFDLRERSAKTIPMDFITEDTEKRTSLTDEGFQDMSNSSAASSMKTVHVEVLERPLFIDFTKSNENRRKRRTFEKLKQRAKDILGMVTLHQMSYALFEMKPIPYELYMATFGRANYTQVAVQTFDDGITEEVQTDDIDYGNKWTQHPIKFTKNTIHINCKKNESEYSLINNEQTSDFNGDYISNPLRVYLEQKDGAGDDKILPYVKYTNMKCDYNVNRLHKFLKKVNGRIYNILSRNTGNTNLLASKYPFSAGYVSISNRDLNKFEFLEGTKIFGLVFSETKTNTIITIHGNTVPLEHRCIICVWDLSATLEPIKVLIATEMVEIGRLRGSSDGIFVAALRDGTVHLWDLSEDANCHFVYGNTDITYGKLRQCAYTSSASNMDFGHVLDTIVGLEFVAGNTVVMENGNKLIGQICILLKRGLLIVYSIIQEKHRNMGHDVGKAFWSRIKLEKYHDINVSDHIMRNVMQFDLNKAKRRLTCQRQSRLSRPKSALTCDRVAIVNWETGIVCGALSIVKHNNVDCYLIGKNGGDVLICKRIAGVTKIDRLCVTGDSSTITVLDATNPPYFLAATDTGTVHLCSLLEYRVLLTLDCRNAPSVPMEKYNSDSKGRFVGCVARTPINFDTSRMDSKLSISSLVWSKCDPFYIISANSHLVVWKLTHSDIHPYKVYEKTTCCIANDRNMGLLNIGGDVEIHKVHTHVDNMSVFEKYINLL